MRYKYIFFDLDGTLTDPKEGITKCVQYALAHFGIHEEAGRLTNFIGPPLVDSFMEFYGFPREKALEAVEKYRERFSSVGIFENRVYDGAEDMLQRLVNAGRVLVLATSKPKVFADVIVKKFGIRPYLKFVSGSELDGTRSHKDEVIEYALKKLGCPRKKTIMVGDRRQDIEGAKKCGIASCGVRFGYAEPGELEKAEADVIAEDMDDLYRILIK